MTALFHDDDILTVAALLPFLDAMEVFDLEATCSLAERADWIRTRLKRFEYRRLKRTEKGILQRYLIILGVLLLFVFSLVLTGVMNLWLGVPSVPTPLPVVRTMIELAALNGDETVCDLGAGDARLLIEAKKRYPSIRAIGCELIPTIWLIGSLRIFLNRQRVTFLLGDAFKQDVTNADVVFLYLFPELMKKLVPRFDRMLKPGTRVVSHTFRFPGKTPVSEKKVRGYWGETTVYVYEW